MDKDREQHKNYTTFFNFDPTFVPTEGRVRKKKLFWFYIDQETRNYIVKHECVHFYVDIIRYGWCVSGVEQSWKKKSKQQSKSNQIKLD